VAGFAARRAGRLFSVAATGFALAADAVVAGAGTIGFAGVTARGRVAAAAGFGPAAGAVIAGTGATGLGDAAAAGAATLIGCGVLPDKLFPAGPTVRTGVAPVAGLVRGSGDGRGIGAVSGCSGMTFGADSSRMIEPAGS
jgi:hypothetical protein